MNKKTLSFAHSSEESTQIRLRRFPFFTVFSISSFFAFFIIGFAVVATVRPALEAFTIEEQQAETVVFANRLSNQLLTKDDFIPPLTEERKKE